MPKRKRVVLSLNDKINIIDSLKKGESGRKLADKYGVGTSTISDIKRNTDSILKFACELENEDRIKRRKVMKKGSNKLLEEALYCWYTQKRSAGQSISGPLLCKKALELNKKIGGDISFVASSGWLHRFRCRYGIREFEIQRKKMSDKLKEENSFKDVFKKELEENDYDLDFVYNCDETVLYWKSLPSKSSTFWQANSRSECKTSKERITMLVCANATGTHKIPLLLVGKSKDPICFKNIKIPLIYNNQSSARMSTDIFTDWYDNTFIPGVKEYQTQIGKQGNVLLLLDDAPTHPSVELLEREDGMFKVKFLPPNVRSSLQPMEQNVIGIFKQLYRKQFLQRLLTVNEDNAEDIKSFIKLMDLKDCCYMIAVAWDLIKRKTLNIAWNNILKRENKDSITDTNDSVLEEINILIPNLKPCHGCDANDIKAWLASDSSVEDFQIMSDDEIVDNILQVHKQKERQEGAAEENVNAENNETPSHIEAFQALETAFKWYERQTECDTRSLLQLKRIRDLAATKKKDCLSRVVIKEEIKIEFS